MNSRRGSTASPIRVVKISSAATASSIRTCMSRRVSGLMVVSHSWLIFFTPTPFEPPLPGRVWVFGCVPIAARIHFTQSLVALNTLAFLGLLEQPGHRGLEARDLQLVIAPLHEPSRPHQVAQGLGEFGDAQIFSRVEKFPRHVFF